jgi:peptidoglycan DL-endopeptidase LytF
MTRRDTIIVAALVNAGLLVVLFVSALKNEEGREEIAYKKEAAALVTHEKPVRSETKRVIGDEIDQVLKQYTKPVATESIQEKPSVASFVEDLNKPAEPAVLTVKAPVQNITSDVTVQKGDVLEKIARRNKTSVSEIMRLNSLSSTNLKIGQVLKIPVKTDEEVKVTAIEKTPLDPTSAKYYTVKPGDNPWTIAVKNHIKVEDLLHLNNMTEDKARKIRPGDQIRIQ